MKGIPANIPEDNEQGPFAPFRGGCPRGAWFLPAVMLSLFMGCGEQSTSSSSPSSSSSSSPSTSSSPAAPQSGASEATALEGAFRTVSTVQLETTPECAIGSITDVEIDVHGNFIIADGWKAGLVYCFAPDGRFLGMVGGRGQGPGEYATPVSLAVGPGGEIAVCDYLQNRLIIYDKDRRYQRTVRGNPRFQYFIHIGEDGAIYAYSGSVDPRKTGVFDTIHKYDDSGREALSFGPIQTEVLDRGFSLVADGMAIGGDGFIYEKNPLFSQIRKFDPSGALVRSFVNPDKGKRTEDIASHDGYYGLFYLRKGFLVAQSGKTVDLFDNEGRFLKGDLPLRHRILLARGDTLYLESDDADGGGAEQTNPVIIKAELK